MLDKPWSWYFKAIGICVLCITLIWALAACSVDGPTISYGGNKEGQEFVSGLEEIPADTADNDTTTVSKTEEYPRYYKTIIDRLAVSSSGNGGFTKILVDIPNVAGRWTQDYGVYVPSVCMNELNVGDTLYLIEYEEYSGIGWAGLNPNLELYPIVN